MEHLGDIDILDLLGNAAPIEMQEQWRSHLRECASCRARRDALQATWDSLGALEVCDSVDLLAGITARIAEGQRPARGITLWELSRIAASVLIAAGIGYTAGKFTLPITSGPSVADASYFEFLAPESATGLAESGWPEDPVKTNGAL